MKALITGATGFVGAHVARRLVHAGWSVDAVTRASSDWRRAAPLLSSVRRLDYDGSAAGLSRLVARSRPDIAVHLASYFVAEHKTEDVDRLVASNILFGAQLLEALASAGTPALVHAGTAWQDFGAHGRAANLYAATKLAFRSLVDWYRDVGALRSVELDIFDTYGPGDWRPKLMRVLRRAETGPVAMSPGRQRLHLVHVDDVAEAFRLAISRARGLRPGAAEIFALPSPRALTLREIARAYEKAASRELSIAWGERPYRNREVMRPWPGTRTLPGWRPSVPLERGLREVLSAQ